MPQQSQDKMKGTSPSPLIQSNVDKDWGAQTKNTTTAQQAIAQQHNKHPYPVKGSK